jgi:hypothetical protein
MRLRWVSFLVSASLTTAAAAQETMPVRPMLEPAGRDPFAPPAPPAPPPIAAASKATPPSPPPAPQAPPLNLAFAGTMVDPDGKRIVFAAIGAETVTLTAGLVLPNGYQVQSIGGTQVELVFPPLGTRATMNIPAAPSFEVR